ncbi:MAG: ABC transporter permease subunit, partial [Clostridia bacterium]|nr:ABC transporter permease subunit [Clostridia bacterium]
MLNPILASSALRRMRSARTIVICGVYIAVLFFLTCLCMSVFLVSDTVTLSDISRGMNTYLILLLAQFALIVLVAPAMTASSIAGERERQTLELLLVTNTGSMRIVFGKLMESFAFLALLIVSSLPVMCLTMLLGGVTLFHILSGLLFLLCCAFA